MQRNVYTYLESPNGADMRNGTAGYLYGERRSHRRGQILLYKSIGTNNPTQQNKMRMLSFFPHPQKNIIFSQIFITFEALKTRFGTAFAEREREREREREITRRFIKT